MKTENILFSKKLYLYTLIALFVVGCSKDDDEQQPVIPNEEEVITTLEYHLMPTAGGDTVVLLFSDPDGDGGTPPVIVTDSLASGTTYNGYLVLLNETVSPADTISLEVLAEADEHQFFFLPTVSGVSVSYSDTDANGKPLGIQSVLNTGSAGSGTLLITLRHMPDKNATGVASGDITNAGGETDIEVKFNLVVK